MQAFNLKNSLVINGWKDNGFKPKSSGSGVKRSHDGEVKDSQIKHREQREHDFLIISDPFKTVLHIEVKKNQKNGEDDAAQQLKSGITFLKESLVFPKEERWNFVSVMYFEETTDVCPDCTEFVLTPDTNFDEWWKKFELQNQEQRSHKKDSSLNECSYLQNCKFLLHQMFKQSHVITEADITRNSEKFFDKSCSTNLRKTRTNKKGFCFLTRVQFSLFNDPSMKRVVFKSAYGTGKTLLIKAKAKELQQEGNKVVIVLFDNVKTRFQFLLKENYDQEFKAFPNNVRVELIKCAGNTIFFWRKKLRAFVVSSTQSH